MNVIRSAVAALAAVAAVPALAWTDGPPADEDTLARATWTVDAPTNRSPQGDDTARELAVAAPSDTNRGVMVPIIAMPLGDGGPGDDLGAASAAPATATAKVEDGLAKPCDC